MIPGAEPFSAAGTNGHGVLVVHGFTGNPQSMRPLAEAFAAAGYSVELPLLPGHGTKIEDMIPTRWEDWSGAAEAAYKDLASRVDKVVVAGLSMGGTITAWLGTRHPEIAGLVLINAAVDPPAESFLDILRGMKDTGAETFEGIGSDIAKPGAVEAAYSATPIEPLLSLQSVLQDLKPKLGDINCPVLIFTSTQDHVVPPVSSDVLADGVSGPVERVTLERSYHVATLDYDAEEIEQRSVDFANKVVSG
jgi:carboxylesterase